MPRPRATVAQGVTVPEPKRDRNGELLFELTNIPAVARVSDPKANPYLRIVKQLKDAGMRDAVKDPQLLAPGPLDRKDNPHIRGREADLNAAGVAAGVTVRKRWEEVRSVDKDGNPGDVIGLQCVFWAVPRIERPNARK